MTKKELQALISQGEGYHLEFKESVNSSLAKEISAFANAKGGRILIGVDDNGNIRTKELSNGDRSKIQDMARDCDPSIEILLKEVEEEPCVLIIEVKEGSDKPYRSTSGFYSREGASSNKRRTDEIYDMFWEEGKFSFDDVLCPKIDFKKYYNPLLLKRFLTEAGIEQVLSDEDTLYNLGAINFVDGIPVFNNTGALFFIDEPERFLSQAIIQCAKYDGIEKINIADQKNMTKDIIHNIDDCFSFLKRTLDVAYRFETGNPKRVEVWEVPYVALKEALINAIAHRDYVHKGTHIQLEIFDDRISITNFGGLVKGFAEADLGKKSAHRNPNLVNFLLRGNFIEKMGTGILRINQELKRAGLPEAEFEISQYWFSIILRRKIKGTSTYSSLSENENDKVLNDRQLKAMDYLKTHLKITRQEYVEQMKTSDRSALRDLKTMVKKGLLTQHGERGRGVFYTLK